MEGIIELQKIYNVKKTGKENGKLKNYGFHRVFVDTPVLYYPMWQSLKLVPKTMWYYAEDALEFMQQNTDKFDDSRWVGFKPHQIARFKRSLDYMKEDFSSIDERRDAEENFVRFFSEYDKRRNRNFVKTFPEFEQLYLKLKAKYKVE